MAGAAAFAAVKAYENKKEEDGEPMEHSFAKKMVASFAAAQVRFGYTKSMHVLNMPAVR